MITTEEQILTRLRLCYLDITGINTATENLIIGVPSDGVLPFVETGIGPNPAIANRRGAQHWEVTQNFVGIAYLSKAITTNTPDIGAQAIANCVRYVSRFRQDFMSHPRLQTTTVSMLGILLYDVEYQQTTQLGVFDGTELIGFQFQLTCKWRESSS